PLLFYPLAKPSSRICLVFKSMRRPGCFRRLSLLLTTSRRAFTDNFFSLNHLRTLSSPFCRRARRNFFCVNSFRTFSQSTPRCTPSAHEFLAKHTSQQFRLPSVYTLVR